MAPIDAHASNAATVSGMFGMYAATRSPSPTPSARSPAAIAAVCARSSPQVHDVERRSSEACWIASPSSGLPRNTCSA